MCKCEHTAQMCLPHIDPHAHTSAAGSQADYFCISPGILFCMKHFHKLNYFRSLHVSEAELFSRMTPLYTQSRSIVTAILREWIFVYEYSPKSNYIPDPEYV